MTNNNSLPIDALRDRFPSLAITDEGQRRIYLDNPAGTQVPTSVIEAISHAMLQASANLGGEFPTTVAAGAIVDAGYNAMADFLGCDREEVVLGPNMTTLTYHFSRMIGERLDGDGLKPGDEIIVTQMDHEGNVSPWLDLAKDKGLVIRKLAFDAGSWQVEPEALKAAITERTKVLALNYSSNLTGSINAVKELAAIARDAGVLTYVDAVQFAPHGFVDVHELDCDFLVCSAYKFFGPHMGILYGRREVLERLTPYKCRCSDTSLPWRFETGTPQIELIAGLTAAVDHFAWLGSECGRQGDKRTLVRQAFEVSQAAENALAVDLINGLQTVAGLTIHGITDPARIEHRVPTISFTLEDLPPVELVRRLNAEGIFCWAGHNYAWEVIHQLGIDPEQGVVRIGIANYNTAQEIEETIESVARNIAMLRQQR